jgi:hypothetical protein
VAKQAKIPQRKDLIEAWTVFYGEPPIKGLSTRLLYMAFAYNKQVQEHGGLKDQTLRDLMRYLKTSSGSTSTKSRTPKPNSPAAGTRFIREWRGRTHVVDVIQEGVQYQGQTYKSLSQVARVITGARWSGPRFFRV